MQSQSCSSTLSAAPTATARRIAQPSSLLIAHSIVQSLWAVLFLLILIVASAVAARAQQGVTPEASAQTAAADQPSRLPFEVSNPHHKKWPEAEATRIYTWACDLLARSIRPEKPPQLHPRFRLVLGTADDEFVRDSSMTEIRLKSWNSEKFAQGVVVVALRDLVPRSDMAKLAHQSVSLASATLDVREATH